MRDTTHIATALRQLKALAFPEHPESDTLDELLLDLAAWDGYVAGIATSLLAGEDPTAVRIADSPELQGAIGAVTGLSESDCAIRLDGLNYLAAVMTLWRALIDAGCRRA